MADPSSKRARPGRAAVGEAGAEPLFTILPEDVREDVLKRTTWEDLMQLRSSSKRWRQVVDDYIDSLDHQSYCALRTRDTKGCIRGNDIARHLEQKKDPAMPLDIAVGSCTDFCLRHLVFWVKDVVAYLVAKADPLKWQYATLSVTANDKKMDRLQRGADTVRMAVFSVFLEYATGQLGVGGHRRAIPKITISYARFSRAVVQTRHNVRTLAYKKAFPLREGRVWMQNLEAMFKRWIALVTIDDYVAIDCSVRTQNQWVDKGGYGGYGQDLMTFDELQLIYRDAPTLFYAGNIFAQYGYADYDLRFQTHADDVETDFSDFLSPEDVATAYNATAANPYGLLREETQAEA